jgi:hypothetical protein
MSGGWYGNDAAGAAQADGTSVGPAIGQRGIDGGRQFQQPGTFRVPMAPPQPDTVLVKWVFRSRSLRSRQSAGPVPSASEP